MRDRAELVGLYRLRAGETRTVAGGILDWQERNRLLQMADEYERHADEVEGSGRANHLMDADAQEIKRYRLRAEELRTIAATTKDRLSREVLLNVAHDQERRAQAREAIAKWDNKASSRNSA